MLDIEAGVPRPMRIRFFPSPSARLKRAVYLPIDKQSGACRAAERNSGGWSKAARADRQSGRLRVARPPWQYEPAYSRSGRYASRAGAANKFFEASKPRSAWRPFSLSPALGTCSDGANLDYFEPFTADLPSVYVFLRSMSKILVVDDDPQHSRAVWGVPAQTRALTSMRRRRYPPGAMRAAGNRWPRRPGDPGCDDAPIWTAWSLARDELQRRGRMPSGVPILFVDRQGLETSEIQGL